MFSLVHIVFIVLVSIFLNIHFCISSDFNHIFYVNNITNIFDNSLFIIGLLNRGNRFLYYNCKVTGESINLFRQGNKFNIHKTFITSESNSVLHIIILIVFSLFSRKRLKYLNVMLFHCFLIFNNFFVTFQINDGFDSICHTYKNT